MDSSFYFDYNALCLFCRDYETTDDNKDGIYFNKVGPNKDIYGNKGTYHIPYYNRKGLGLSTFYKLCAYHLYNGNQINKQNDKKEHYINFAQYLPNIAPLCLDFDLVCNFTDNDKKKFKSGDNLHIYNFNHISKIVEILNDIIYNNFEIEKEDIKAYVQEKEHFKFKGKEEVKDGLHIIYLSPFSVAQRFFIRDELIKKLEEINFKDSFNFEITNSYDEIVDEAVIERNPWLTYGSIKVNMKKLKDKDGNIIYYTNKKGEKKAKVEYEYSLPYILTHILDFDLYDENYDSMGNTLTYEEEEDLEYLMNLFNLDQFSDDDPLDVKTKKAEMFIEKLEIEKENKIKRIEKYESRIKNSNSDSEKHERIIFNYNLNTETLLKMIKILKKREILYKDYEKWFPICSAIHKNFTDHKIPEEDIKNAIIDFSKCWKSFNISHFEEKDYPDIVRCANNNSYSLKKPLHYIKKIDFEKYNKLKEIIYKKSKKRNNYKNEFKNNYSFNNYKKNNYSVMNSVTNSSDSYIKKEKQTDKKLSIIDYYNKIDNEYYEQYKNDDIEIETEKIPELIINQGKQFERLRYDLLNNEDLKGKSKNEIIDVVSYYLFKRVLYIQGEENYYVYDFENKIYVSKSKTLAYQYIYDKDLEFEYINKEGKQKKVLINPKKLYLNYIDFNHWERRRDINQPKLYKEIKLVNGEEIESKNIFNDGPSIPSYLTENYKTFNEYGQKYKDFVKGFFLLLKYSLCDGKEKDYNYLKNWVINKALFKRNRTVLVLQSPGQGIGKSTVAQMIKAMCEDKYVSIGNKCDWLNEKFNSILNDKILIGIEEMTVSDSKAVWKTMLNRMKDLTTNSTTVLEFKGKEPFDADIEFDFVITSNYYNNFASDVENRRYFIPTVATNKYREIPEEFKPEILNTHPIIIKENEKIKKIKEIKNIEQLCKYLNSIIINKGNSDVHLTKQEKRKYFRCFYAYCNENQNEDFEPSFMPITDEIKQSADKTMKFIYKYIKIKELYGKSHLEEKQDKDEKRLIRFITTDIKYDIKDFAYSLYKNECILKRYNYLNSCVYEFIKEIGLPEKNSEASEISSKKINEYFKRYFKDYVQYKQVKSKNAKCYIFECSYDELLEFYKSNGYIIDSEYEKLKDNYNVLKYCDYNDYSNSNNNYYEQVNELKQKLNEKDNLLKKYDEELKEKDRTIEHLESFKDDCKDKEIENLKISNDQKDKEIERLKAELEELKKLSLKTKENKISLDLLNEEQKAEYEELKKIFEKEDILLKELRDIYKRLKKIGIITTKLHNAKIEDYRKKELKEMLSKYF